MVVIITAAVVIGNYYGRGGNYYGRDGNYYGRRGNYYGRGARLLVDVPPQYWYLPTPT